MASIHAIQCPAGTCARAPEQRLHAITGPGDLCTAADQVAACSMRTRLWQAALRISPRLSVCLSDRLIHALFCFAFRPSKNISR